MKMMMNTARLLLVDDMPQVLQDLRTVLPLVSSAYGVSLDMVGEARNGQAALQQVQALQPDVILMDLEMPGMDGYTATRQIKICCPSIRVVILSVHGGANERQKASQAGADAFIVKGDSLSEIIQAIQSF
jgi:DNA-binding NarL/FixJ family response regulator